MNNTKGSKVKLNLDKFKSRVFGIKYVVAITLKEKNEGRFTAYKSKN